MTTLEPQVLSKVAHSREVAMDFIRLNSSSKAVAPSEASVLTLVAMMDPWINTV